MTVETELQTMRATNETGHKSERKPTDTREPFRWNHNEFS